MYVLPVPSLFSLARQMLSSIFSKSKEKCKREKAKKQGSTCVIPYCVIFHQQMKRSQGRYAHSAHSGIRVRAKTMEIGKFKKCLYIFKHSSTDSKTDFWKKNSIRCLEVDF